MVMLEIKDDKQLLVEVTAWAEKVLAETGGRFSKPKATPDAMRTLDIHFDSLRAVIKTELKAGNKFVSEKIISKAKLSLPEIQVLYLCLHIEFIERNSANVSTLIKALSALNRIPPAAAAAYFSPAAPLFKNKILYSASTGVLQSANLVAPVARALLGIPGKKKKGHSRIHKTITARQIYDGLCERVVAQDAAKKRVAAAVFRHLKAVQLNRKRRPMDRIQKANILIIGPTGTGKTHIARTLSDILKVPFVSCDATQYTESGYVGMDVEDMLVKLHRAADKDMKAMQNGIIYVDEIDKIASRDARASHNTTKDVSGLSVQQEMLKLLDGTKINYARHTLFGESENEYDVEGVLFIAGGAFEGLGDIVKERLKAKCSIGFRTAQATARLEEALAGDNWIKHLITEDLIAYGFIPEFIGRFASIVTLNPLSQDDILNVLTKPKNSLNSQYTAILQAAGINRGFSESELKAVAEEAYALNTGARALKAIMEARIAPLLFEAAQPPAPPKAA